MHVRSSLSTSTRRVRIGVALSGAALLLLAACGSGDAAGTATTATSATLPATATTAAAPSSAPASSASSASSSSAPADPTTASSSESSEPGGEMLDEASIAWMDAMCSNMAPVKELSKAQSMVDQNDLEGTYQRLSKLFGDAGTATGKAADELGALPPPTFENGAEYAATTIGALEELSPKLTKLSDLLAKADPTDASSMAEVPGLQQEIAAIGQKLIALPDLDPAVSAQIATIDSCASL